ncbi:MAG: hypothetical protein EGQ20_06355 [Bacteroides oleiciplenus]|nr:hypothetical protein [Bacteroides oleiciplenus]
MKRWEGYAPAFYTSLGETIIRLFFTKNLNMKKLYVILVVLNTISLILLIQIVLGWIPSFECTYSIDKIDKINSLIVDLSIGVITSTFFYYILVYIPERRKRKVIRSIISNDLLYIANHMQMTLAYVVKTYSLEVKDKYYKEIPLKELLKIKNESHIKFENCFLNTEILPNIVVENAYTINADIKMWYFIAQNILERIKNVNNIPNIIFEDEVLISTLDKISRCTFYSNIHSITEAPKHFFQDNNESLPLVFSFYSIKELHSLYVTLTKFITPHIFQINDTQ